MAAAEEHRQRRKRRRSESSSSSSMIRLSSWLWFWGFAGAAGAEDYNNNNKRVGALDVQSFCQQNLVIVNSAVLTCDSPGAYYYGSSAYRNSEVCMSNDKARLRLSVSVRGDMPNMYMTLSSGIYDHYQVVLQDVDFCGMSFTGESVYYNCPGAGLYTLQAYYTIPQIQDYDFHYTPDIKLIFTNADGRRVGCATTGTVALHKRADTKAFRGLVALGVSVIVFVVVFAVLLYLSYQRKKRIERQREVRKYNYYRTTPTGKVISLPGQMQNKGLRQVSSSDSSDANNSQSITNPSYNNPRPII